MTAVDRWRAEWRISGPIRSVRRASSKDRCQMHSSAEKPGRINALDRLARPAATAVKRAVPPGWRKDLLSGTRLGHPLHPLLTDIPIGALTSATVLDLLGGRPRQDAADALVTVGVLSALPTIAAGAADWSDTYGPDQRVGVVHAVSNALGIGLYAWSLRARRPPRRHPRRRRTGGPLLACRSEVPIGAAFLGASPRMVASCVGVTGRPNRRPGRENGRAGKRHRSSTSRGWRRRPLPGWPTCR